MSVIITQKYREILSR